MTATHDLTTGSIPGHFRRMAIPVAIGMVFTTLYNVVDSYFAGLISTDALAGLTISFTVFFMLIAFGFGLNSALGALVGSAIGARHTVLAQRLACQGLVCAGIVSVMMMGIGYLTAPMFIRAVSEPGTFRELAIAYLHVLMLAAPTFLLAFAANGILSAQGDTVSMQRAQLGACLANVGLNPLMIFGIPGLFPAFGFNGIALSTLTSQTGVMLYILWRLSRSELLTGCLPDSFRPRHQDMREIAALALPAASSMVIMLLGTFVVQLYLRDFGPEAVAAYGIGLRIEQMLLLPGFGLTIALLPIAAQNIGARNHDRVREAFAFCCKAGLVLMLLASCLLWFAARPAMSLFTPDADVIRIGGNYLNVDGFILPLYLLLFAMNSLLQAMKRPMISLWIGIVRQGLGIALFCALFVIVLEFDTWGVWFGIATSVLTGFVLALGLTHRVARQEIGGLFRRPVHP